MGVSDLSAFALPDTHNISDQEPAVMTQDGDPYERESPQVLVIPL